MTPRSKNNYIHPSQGASPPKGVVINNSVCPPGQTPTSTLHQCTHFSYPNPTHYIVNKYTFNYKCLKGEMRPTAIIQTEVAAQIRRAAE